MGTSLTFVHFYDVEQDKVIKALSDYLAGKHYHVTEEPWTTESGSRSSGASKEGYPDNADYLVSPRRGKWVTIIESNSSALDLELEAMCKDVSKRLGNYAMLLAVYDSDVVTFDLYHKGKRTARYTSNPEYFQQEDASDIDKQRLDIEQLKAVLPGGLGIKKVADVLNEGFWNKHDNAEPIAILDDKGERKYLFEENRMEDFATLLEINGKGGGYPFLGWDVTGHMNWQGFKGLSVTKAGPKKASKTDRPDKYDKLIDLIDSDLIDSDKRAVVADACRKLECAFDEYKLKDRHVRLIPKLLPMVERHSEVVTIDIPEGSPIPLPKGPFTTLVDDPFATLAILFLREISQCVEPHNASPKNQRVFFERWWADEGPTLSLFARMNERCAYRMLHEMGLFDPKGLGQYDSEDEKRYFTTPRKLRHGVTSFEKFGYRFAIDVLNAKEWLVRLRAEPTDKKYGELYMLQDPGLVEKRNAVTGETYQTASQHFRRGAPASLSDPDYGGYMEQRSAKYVEGFL